MSNILLKVNNITKRFGPTVALNNVSTAIYSGEIRGLIGENGSGKSTLSSIIAGMQKPTDGTMVLRDEPYAPQNMIDAGNKGIGMIIQERGTISGISIAENIFLGNIERFRHGCVIRKKEMVAEATKILGEVGMEDVDPMMPMDALNFQDRKLVEIAKVIHKDPDLLIVDETTTALSQTGRKKLYQIMQKQKENGKSVLFISHDLDELMEVCDTLTVLRDGNLVESLDRSEFEEDKIKQLMVGRELKGNYYRADYDGSCSDEVVLSIKNGNKGRHMKDFNLELHKGEILGIGGLSHCGMHTVGKVLFGAETMDSGYATLGDGTPIKSEKQAMGHAIGYVSKDRDIEALALNSSIKDNISVAALDKLKKAGLFIFGRTETKHVKEQAESLSIKCANINQFVSHLSGGNKQKVVFGKWIGAGSDILILDCPTRGVDIGVKQAMYQLIYKLKQEGKSFVVISEELAELIGMCDRIVIMKDGEITREFDRSPELSEAQIIDYMI